MPLVHGVALASPTGKSKDEDQLHQNQQQVSRWDGHEFQVSDSGDGKRHGVWLPIATASVARGGGGEKWVCLWEPTLTLS